MKYNQKSIAVWLFICAFSVFLMAVIGAVTRLTESGLSIVEWKPITGALPPMTLQDWQAEFARYQDSPQYIKVNKGMSLDEFKQIYFWEWLHRLWGRCIGVLFFVPFVLFLLRKRIEGKDISAFTGVLALGFLQGVMGWFMVKSGLVDHPAVSHYRLAAHLILAAFIYALLFKLGLRYSLRPDMDATKLTVLRKRVMAVLVMVFMTMTWGAFVAGLRAGLLYNTFPTMDGYWLPPEIFAHKPMWRAFFEEPAVVQFTHRLLAMATFIMVLMLFRRARAFHLSARLSRLFHATVCASVAQVVLGISTLMTHVNIVLASMHQAGAFVVLALMVWLLHEIPFVPQEQRKRVEE